MTSQVVSGRPVTSDFGCVPMVKLFSFLFRNLAEFSSNSFEAK